MAAKDKLKLAVVGVGHLGQHHARIYSQMEGVDLVCVVDTDEAKAKSVAHRCKTQYKTEYHQIETALDAVNIAVPTKDHFEVAQHFLAQGIDVLLEKPITQSLEQAEQLAKLSHKTGAILQIGHVERFNPAVMALTKRVKFPKYIESHRLGPFVARGTDVDVILDLMIHDLDVVLSLVSSPLERVQAVGIPIVSEHIDIANVRLEFEDGCVANMNASRVSLTQMRKIRIFQQNTYFSLDCAKQSLTTVRLNTDSPSRLTGLPFKISRGRVKVKKQEPLKAELEAFIQCVRHRQRPLVSAQEGLQALNIALKINAEIKQAIQKSMQASTKMRTA
jgi:predicted dehydrogenase